MPEFLNGRVIVHHGDCLAVIKTIPDCSIDSVTTDPPYALVSIVKRFGGANAAPAQHGRDGAYKRASAGFMGKQWDTGDVAFAVEFWAEVYRVLKPGGHVAAFSGTRTYHRLAVAIEDAGFEIRDQLAWVYGSGFPKSHNVAVSIDKMSGVPARGKAFNMKGRGDRAEELDANGREFLPPYEPATESAQQWQGWGTALKPAWEPIALARKPLIGTVAANVLAHGTGAINIDGCRVAADAGDEPLKWEHGRGMGFRGAEDRGPCAASSQPLGRWPANLLHDGSDEVVGLFPDTASGYRPNQSNAEPKGGSVFPKALDKQGAKLFDDSGSAARFFYSAKADADDRIGSKHPTVKPVDLMQWLVRLITPPGGVTLDPFAGSGTTGEAAFREGMRAVLIEREPEYQADIARRMALALAGPEERKRESIKAKVDGMDQLLGPLFDGLI